MIFAHIYTKKKTPKKGFTLIETLVSLGIFSIVVVSASGVILSIISSNKKNQAVSSVVNNLNYSIESMVRDIKTGYKYQCNYGAGNLANMTLSTYKSAGSSCDGVSSTDNITLISTITGKEQIVTYNLVGLDEDAYISKTLFTEDTSGVVTSVSYPLTNQNNVIIKSLGFTVNTPHPLVPSPTDGSVIGQPSVFLILTGTAKVNQINISDFFIQTYISQRLPNFI